MKLIRELEELIEDEIEDVEKYAKMAAELKATHPGLAQALYTISTQEDTHQAALHTEVVKLIEEHKRTHGAPPAAMQAVYDYLHERQTDRAREVKVLQEMYK